MHSGFLFFPTDRPALMLHGGAWDIPFPETEAHLNGLRRAAEHGAKLLRRAIPALDVVTEVVAQLEDHPAFDAGYGGVLNQAGAVELDAGVMCGETLAFGAVAGVKRLANPVRVARQLVDEAGQERLLVAEGAEAYAAAHGFDLIENASLIIDRERLRFEHLRERARFHTSQAFLPNLDAQPQDTVGCVARDTAGCLAAATSTGGTPFTRPGRVGDSPLPGCGFYADSVAAVSATGWGEAIAALVLSSRTVDHVRAGQSPDQAAVRSLTVLQNRIRNPRGRGATGGLIVVDQLGNTGWAYTTPRMARAGWSAGGTVWTAL